MFKGRLAIAVLVAVVGVVAPACESEENQSQCGEMLAKEQKEVALDAVEKLAVVQAQTEQIAGGVSRRKSRSLAVRASESLRVIGDDLERVFSSACA